MAQPSVYFSIPTLDLLRYPPASLPRTVSPPTSEFVHGPAFTIPPEIYHRFLHLGYPLTIGLVYATTVLYINRINRQNGHKPWTISKTSLFFAFVVVHNVFLAVYSGWTFRGMALAISRTWPDVWDEHGLVRAVDSLCNMHGPSGLGQAVIYNKTREDWDFTGLTGALGLASVPDPTVAGRLWNEGLAFYGWLFYISKFYEVVDTMIILAKGKESSTLQVFHHTGAMVCMWAGIRYMSPPIWMFVWVNSGIHALMYTYYALTAIGVRVPQAIKRTLTSMQIFQFLFGASYALAHLFLTIDMPVTVGYKAASSPASNVSPQVIVATASATSLVGYLKRLAFGEEDSAEKEGQQPMGIDTEPLQDEVRYRTEYRPMQCISTSGQAFAIWLNIIYLAPLTYLFVRFFIKAYLIRNAFPASGKRGSKAGGIEKPDGAGKTTTNGSAAKEAEKAT